MNHKPSLALFLCTYYMCVICVLRTCVHGSQRSASRVFLNCSYFIGGGGTRSPTEPGACLFSWTSWPASLSNPVSFHPPQHWSYKCAPSSLVFYTGSKDPNSGPSMLACEGIYPLNQPTTLICILLKETTINSAFGSLESKLY